MGRQAEARGLTRPESLVAALMGAQALSGLVWRSQYRDVEWIKLSWLGNDAVTLLVAVPLLLWAQSRGRRHSMRHRLAATGVLAYALYNSAFYLFGADLNVFFPLYILLFLAAASTLTLRLRQLTSDTTLLHIPPGRAASWCGAALFVIGSGLGTVWLALWAGHVFAGRPTPVEPDAFRLVAALDLSLLVPAMIIGGTLLWRGHPLGFVVAPVASVLGALYLLVLSVNTVLSIRHGLSEAPGELIIWVPCLTALTTIAATLLTGAEIPPPASKNAPVVLNTEA